MKLNLALAALFTTLSAPAFAQDTYGQIFGGYSNLQDSSFSGTIGGGPQSVHTDFDNGYSLGLSVGRGFGTFGDGAFSLRGDLELSFGENDVDSVDFTGNGAGAEANAGGSVRSTRVLANVIADFNTRSSFTPYAGFGLGVDFVDHDIVYGSGVTITGTDQALAAQLILGTSYDINESVSLFADTRFIRSFDVESTRTSPGGTARVRDDLDHLNVNFGVRYKF